MIGSGRERIRKAGRPSAALGFVILLALNLVGDGLNDALALFSQERLRPSGPA